MSHTSLRAQIASTNHCHHLSCALCLCVAVPLSPDTSLCLGGPAAGASKCIHAPSSVALDWPPPPDSLSPCLFSSRPDCTPPSAQPEFCPSASLSTLNAALLSSFSTLRSCFAHSSYTCSFSKPPTFASLSLSSHTSSSSLSTRPHQFLPPPFNP